MTSLQKTNVYTSNKQDHEIINIKSLLSQGLYSIQSTVKNLTKKHLALLSTPGVAEVCLHVQAKSKQIDTHSIRGRSIAIVTRGKLLGAQGRQFLPIMDWYVAQIKYYSNIDCYSFIIREECGLKNLFLDLSNSYSGVLFLDNEKIPEIITASLNFFVLSHWEVNQLIKGQITDAQQTSYVLAHLINNCFSGNVTIKKICQYLQLGKSKIKEKEISEDLLDQGEIKINNALNIHKKLQGKIGVSINFTNIQYLKNVFTYQNLTKLIQQKIFIQCSTAKLNAIVTDGTAVLGLGNIGPVPALPVMQMKCMMFKLFGDVSVIPLCINPRPTILQQMDAILDLVHLYKAINLQDIKAPQCFSIERNLQKMDILPVFHDDQHGTAIAALAGVINAIKLAKKKPSQCKVVVNGAGAAGINIARIFVNYGFKNVIVCDTSGTIYKGRQQNMNQYKKQIAQVTNLSLLIGQLKDAIVQADILIGVSIKGAFKKEWIQLMNEKPIVFAMANPDPEITREDAMQGGCFIYGSGKSNQPNQITNSLVYPGVFRGINQHKISRITQQMQVQIAEQIAYIKEGDATKEQILPNSLNKNISIRISQKLKQLKKNKQYWNNQ